MPIAYLDVRTSDDNKTQYIRRGVAGAQRRAGRTPRIEAPTIFGSKPNIETLGESNGLDLLELTVIASYVLTVILCTMEKAFNI